MNDRIKRLSEQVSGQISGYFELAAGSIAGRHHQLVGKNNQDAFYTVRTDSETIAVVCDGCSSGMHSEIGAKLGTRWVADAIAQTLCRVPESQLLLNDNFWQNVQQQVLVKLQALAQDMGGCTFQLVQDYFLFTIVGALVTPAGAAVFSLGDGVMAINGQIFHSGPFPNNAPPYLAYQLLDRSLAGVKSFQVQVHQQLPVEKVETILIGTDGVVDLMTLSDRRLPGKSETVGPIEQFWQEDCYFRNSDAVRRRLALINRELTRPDWQERRIVKQSGLLRDDTTLVAIRRKERLAVSA